MSPTKKKITPDDIKSAPITAPTKDLDIDESAKYEKLVASLQAQLAAKTSELDKLKGKRDVATVRATMMEPYANKVFFFLCSYVGVVGLMLCLSAWCDSFNIPESVQAIIAGSTAVSAIGLVGFVVNGLFKN